uniref:Uncharacterized protein n=1 Tax=Schistosoma japonicum TaxID=6182 RepID=C1LKG5_SCHJA|nr:hypothetical protein [Schistosoma japonicum]CAX75193.1 hypothetical protein [Schistosoma japonicum]CAX75195.1 hypothetical protein [Schistosoma japonicum]
MMFGPSFSMKTEPSSKPKSGFFSNIYNDPYKWSLVKSVTMFASGVFGFLIIYEAMNAPVETL